MSGEAVKVKSISLPAPTGGLNLVANPWALQQTEARVLDNYYVHDWGIRQRGRSDFEETLDDSSESEVGQMVRYYDTSGVGYVLVCTDKNVYRWGGATVTTNKTASVTITTPFTSSCIFNKKIFLVNGTDAGAIYDIATEALTTVTTTPNMSSFTHVWNYKNRLYGSAGTTIYYGAVDAVAGTLTSLDIASTLNESGKIAWGSSWSVNQGDQNEDLMAIGMTSGEILIYSGDWPASPNWQLVSRVKGPAPVGQNPVTQFGQDLLITTARGVVSLRSIVATASSGEALYVVTRKLGDILANFTGNADIAFSILTPFMYLLAPAYNGSGRSGYHEQSVWVLNYELGAWSQLRFPLGGEGEEIQAIEFLPGGSDEGRLIFAVGGGSDVKLYRVRLITGEEDTAVYFDWRTPFFDLGTKGQKVVKFIRALSRYVAGANAATRNVVSISASSDFADPATAQTDTASTAETTYDADLVYPYRLQELSPPGVGQYISVAFGKNSLGENNGEVNDLAGVEIYYEEERGAY